MKIMMTKMNLSYSTKVSLGGGIAILLLGGMAYLFDGRIDIGWFFVLVWGIVMSFILYGIIRKWF
jgi:hypothetical protein